MKRFAGMALLVIVVAIGAYAAVDNRPQPKAPVQNDTIQEDSTAIPKKGNGDILPPSASVWKQWDADVGILRFRRLVSSGGSTRLGHASPLIFTGFGGV